MPPDMVLDRPAIGPVIVRVVEPGAAFLQPTLHLHDMRHGMNGPKIVGVALDRIAAERLRPGIVTHLLETEGEHAEHEAIARHVVGPGRQGAGDAVAHRLLLAEPEILEVHVPHGHEIERPFLDDGVPAMARPRDVSGDPMLERREMQPFAPVQLGARRIDRLDLRPDLRKDAVRAHQPEHRGLEDARHDEARIGLDRLAQQIARVEAVFEVVIDRLVEERHRVVAVAREGEPPPILSH